MEDKGEVLYELKPTFNFLYELVMPTGRKIRSALMSIILAIVIKVILIFSKSYILGFNNELINSIYNVCDILMILVIILTMIFFAARIIFQILEYRGMSYKFYEDCMTSENTFLNQTRKTIDYINIREVEIRRSIIDRIMGFGIIIVYTNAEKAYGSATVIYAIKDTQRHYNEIEKIIYKGKDITVKDKTLENENPVKEEN